MNFIDTVTLRPEHGYVFFVVLSIPFLHTWACMKVQAARIQYNIHYPQMYAEKSDKNAKEFNCIQRAHQNILENIPLYVLVQLISGIHRPRLAALAGTIRIIGFIVYFISYSSGNPEKRNHGFFGVLAFFLLVGMSMECTFRLCLNDGENDMDVYTDE